MDRLTKKSCGKGARAMRLSGGLIGIMVAALAVASGVGVAAQSTVTPSVTLVAVTAVATPPSPFQVIRVGDFAYSVDPFYPCVDVLTSRWTKLSSGEDGAIDGLITTLTFQPFNRSGDQMVAGESFSTYESEITQGVQVGTAFVCGPQVAAGGVALTPLPEVALPGIAP